MEPHSSNKAWLFQYSQGSHVSGWIEKSKKGTEIPWKVSRYGKEMRAGDVVFIWRTGTDGGLAGWGTISSDKPSPYQPGGGEKRINVIHKEWLAQPVSREEVKAGKEMNSNLLFSVSRGTNFRISISQADELRILLKKNGAQSLPDLNNITENNYPKKKSSNAKEVKTAAPEIARKMKPQEKTSKFEKMIDPNLVVKQPELSEDNNEISEIDFTTRLPNYTSDHADAEADDLIGVEEEAQAFARYLASQDIEPPLSIALFGDWGSGKTFLMNKIRRHVSQLDKAARRAESNNEKCGYCGGIVQIEFNAWHYIESNLWASLVEHVFSELDNWLRDEKSLDADKRDALFHQLKSAQEQKQLADNELRLAEEKLDNTKKNLENLKSEALEAASKLKEDQSQSLWPAVTMAIKSRLTNDPALQKKIKEAGKTLGLPKLHESATQLKTTLDQAGQTVGRARLIMTSIFAKKRAPLMYAFLVALVAVAPFAVGWIWSYLSANKGFPDVGAGVAEISALATILTSWLAKATYATNKALDFASEADSLLQESINKQTIEQQKIITGGENEVAALSNQISSAEKRFEHAENKVNDLKVAIREDSARARLNRFIQERVSNGEYSQHLGLVSTIRKDFQKLSEIMLDEDATSADKKKLPKGIEIDDLRKFKRVILYIDDLDRCPPDRVVDVLEAVHLLLSFKLFVVVVGVDARWVSRSLKKRYPSLLSENVAVDLESEADKQVTTGHAVRQEASSHDYLEKIFQVPYWVKPMDDESCRRFVKGLAQSDLKLSDATNENDDVVEAVDSAGNETDESPLIPVIKEESPVLEQEEIGDSQTISVEEEPLTEFQFNINPENISLTQYEVDFMEKLAPFVGRSPRRAKRFVNIYRIIKAGLSQEEFQKFVGENGESTNYRALLAQLAVVTGAPINAPHYFAVLRNREKIITLSENGGLMHSLETTLGQKSPEEWRILKGILSILEESPSELEMLERLRFWSGRAMRYSFTARPA